MVTGNTHFSFVAITRFMGALSAKIWWWWAQIHFNESRPSPSPSRSPPGDIECENHDHEPDKEQHPGQCASHDVDLGRQVQLHNFFFFCKLHWSKSEQVGWDNIFAVRQQTVTECLISGSCFEGLAPPIDAPSLLE